MVTTMVHGVDGVIATNSASGSSDGFIMPKTSTARVCHSSRGVGKIPAAPYRSIVDMDWSMIVAVFVVDSVGGSESTAPSSPFTSAWPRSELAFQRMGLLRV